ncbi:MAG TPA: YDG domain-containing protein [Gallionella sp.]|nr:YDG domain-containing protein [Gallionella sp.]
MESVLVLPAYAQPVGGVVSAGTGTIDQSVANTTTVNQTTQNLAINWQSFNTISSETVQFTQPGASSIALNRVLDGNPTSFFGSLSANGQVFVLNPNGVLFGSTAQVNVGGLVASTLSLSDTDFMAGNNVFTNVGAVGTVDNQGTLNAASGGYVALLGPAISNNGTITAPSGVALLGAGDQVTLTVSNGSLLSYSIDQGTLNALAENNQLIQADGGQVILSAKAADTLSTAVVNNTGIVEAHTIQNVGGIIKLMSDMQNGSVNVGGTLDASAPNGGNGGLIETSAAHVKIADGSNVTTAAPQGLAGNWLIDPYDFTIAATGGDITGAALSTALGVGAVTIQTAAGSATCTGATCGTGNAAGIGDIIVNDPIAWTANTTLTLSAYHDVNVNQIIDASVGATGAGSVVLRADNTGNGPGAAAGTVNFSGAGAVALNTGTANFFYNPSSYATPTNYATNVTGGTLSSYMLVFVDNSSATAQNKTYDGNTTATLNTPFTFLAGPDGLSAGQLVSLSAGVAGFNSKDVATATTVNFSGYGLGGTDAGLYSLFSQPASQAASITPATLTATIAAQNKVYDGTTTATPTFTITGGLVGTETVTATGTATFNSKNVLTANLVTADSNVLADGTNGGLASNYSLATGQTVAANITPLALTGAAIAPVSTTYGTAAAAGAVSFGNVISGDTVTSTASIVSPLYSTSGNLHVGSYTQTASTISGADSANYSFAGFTSAANYNVSQLALTGAAIAPVSTTYGTAATAGAVSFGNVVSGDVVTGTASVNTGATSTSGNYIVGSYTQTVSSTLGGTDAGNYTFAGYTSAANYTINPLALTVSGIAVNTKVYDGTTSATLNLGSVSFGGLITGDAVSIATGSISGSFVDKNAGNNKIVTLSGVALSGTDAGNYTVAGVGGVTGTITPLALTGAAIATSSSTYGSALNPGAVTFGNVISGDTVTATASVNTGATSTSGNYIVGSYTQTASTTLGGADAGNYTFAGFTSAANYTINKLALTGAAIAASSSIYGSALNPGAVSFGNVISGDTVTATAGVNTGATSTSGNYIVGSYTQTAGTTLGGTDAGNYSFAGFTSAANYTINKLALAGAAIAASSSTYGAALAPGAVSFGNLIGGDLVTATAGVNTGAVSSSGNFVVGSYTQTAATTLGGTDAGNYTFAGFTSAANYSINPLALTGAAIAAVSTTYGTSAASGAVTFGNIIGTDVVTSTSSIVSPAYSTSNNLKAGSYTQTASAISGADAANYSFAGFTSAANYTVGQLALTGAAIAASSSIYGSALNPGAVSFGNVISGDLVTGTAGVNTGATSSSGNFVAGSYTQTASTTLGGTDAANYSFAGFTSASNYTINPLALTGAAIASVSTTYGTPAATGAVSFGNIIGTDVVTSTSSIVNPIYSGSGNLNAGSYTQTASAISGADSANYSFAGFTSAANYTVNPFAVSMTGSRVYDGTTIVDASIFTLGPLVGTETLTLSGSGNVASKDVGTYPVILPGLTLGDGTNGGLASNYTFTGGTQTATIDPAQLYVAIIGNPTKVYDGNTSATLSSANFALTGFVAGEGGTVNTGTAGTYYTDAILTTQSKDVLTATTVASTLAPTDFTANTGTLLSNYILPTAAVGAGQITPYVVSMSGSRQYDGTTNAAASMFTTAPGTMGTLVGTETLTLSGAGTVASKNVGTYSTALGTFSLGTLALGDGTNGGMASNYTLVGGTQTATITPYVVKLYGSRSYNQSAIVDASVFGTVYGVTVGGISETLTLTGSGSMTDKNAGPGKPVALGTLALGNGVDLGPTYSWLTPGLVSNYTLVGSLPKVTILGLPISITGLTAQNKVYDGNTTATLTGTASISGMLSGDVVSLSSTPTGVFANKNVGNKIQVILGPNTLSGADAGNYILQQPVMNANITPKPLTITGTPLASNKVYDGNTSATISGITVNGVVSGDAASMVGTFVTPNVGTGLNVSVALTGKDAANYSYTLPGVTADITPRALTYTGTPVAANKVYDGTLIATVTGITGISGLVAGDVNDITVSGLFADKNVGTGKAVTLSLSGLKASNYTLPASGLTANITKATIANITGITAGNKTYDASTAASLVTSGAVFAGMVSGDVLTVSGATGTFSNKNVGTAKTVNISGITLGGADAGNYSLSGSTASATANITPAILAVTGVTVANKVYDATTAATLVGTAKVTVLGSDVVTLGGSGSGVFANKNVGNGKIVTVTGYTISGADAGNYTLVQPTGLTANISQRALTYTGTPVVPSSKVYDGNAYITVSGATLNGVLGGDSVSLTGLFANPNVGTNKPVSLALLGTDGGNYSISQPGGLISSITPRLLIVSADNKTMMFGGTIPPLTYTVGGAGLVLGDSINTVFSGLLAVNVTGKGTTPITQGTLALTVGPGGNYSISSFINGVMTVQ